MRKLLLTTTALIAASAISAAHADVSISGDMMFGYRSLDSGIATTAGQTVSDDEFISEQNVKIVFSNKTDSGLNISMTSVMESVGNADVTAQDEAYFEISGGFGTLTLGSDDGAGDKLTVTAADFLGPFSNNDHGGNFMRKTTKTTRTNTLAAETTDNVLDDGTARGNLADDNADLIADINDANNITYMLPKMGGLSLGVSMMDAGAGKEDNADIAVIAGKYEFESGAVKGSVHYANANAGGYKLGRSSTNSSSIGVKISSGPISAIVAKAESDVANKLNTTIRNTEVTDYGLSYDVGNGLVLSAVGTAVTEDVGGESIDITSVTAKYTIASGLDAYFTYHDYDYNKGTSSETSDDGSATFVGLKASF